MKLHLQMTRLLSLLESRTKLFSPDGQQNLTQDIVGWQDGALNELRKIAID